MEKKENNFAFIDSQNLNLGIRDMGWKLDYKRFRRYLKEKYGVFKAYLFLGYLPTNQDLYKWFQESGYVLIFKPVIPTRDGEVKGNVDADLVLQSMIDFDQYNKAVIITSDGDFQSLVKYLKQKNKLEIVLSPNIDKCSVLLKKAAQDRIDFISNLRQKLEYKKKNTA